MGETKGMRTTDVRCEYATEPLGIDAPSPRFSWLLESDARGATQSAYHILVASSPDKLASDAGDKWDSGTVESNESLNVPYDGAALLSGEKCWWKVRVTDATGTESDWSEPASFEMALLDQADWHGKWIGTARGVPAPLLRKEFELAAGIKKARLYISGIGWSEAYINGNKISDRVLDPAASEYQKSVYYVAHDVTDALKSGTNAIGTWLGNGWYCEPEFARQYGDCPRVLVQLNIELDNGEIVNVVSDESWNVSGSCIILNDFWNGEIYDARLETPGWSEAGFDDAAWSDVEVKAAPGGVLRSQLMAPIRVINVRKPARFTEPKPNVYLYDFGQLFGGWVRLRLKGQAGTKVTIKYSGRVYEESGLIDKRRHEAPKATDYYVLKGDPEGEVYEPRFTYHPVNYVQIEGSPCELTIHDVEGCVVHTDEDLSGGFECADELLNKIHKNVKWTLTNGLFGMPLDCLHREHWAWTDPATITGSLYPRKYMPIFWTKWLRDIADSQQEDGSVPQICPAYLGAGFDAAWGGNYPTLVWYLCRYFGDERMLVEHYDGMKRCVDHMETVSEDLIITGGLYGDHMLPGSKPGEEEFISSETPRELVWTGYLYRGALTLSKAAEVLGKKADVARYVKLADDVAVAMNSKWLDTKKHVYDKGSQTSQAFPLALGIVPEADKAGVLKKLIKSIAKDYDYHHHTGNTGTTCLIDKLADLGHPDVMYRIATQTTYPGWGFMVSEGATTIWESWSLIAGCGNAESMIMWATIDEFFYNDLAGIKGPDYYGTEEMAPGFREVCIAPYVPEGLNRAKAEIKTVLGNIASSWWRTGNGIILQVTVPPNATARVSVPKIGIAKVLVKESRSAVWENGKYIDGVDGITGGSESDDYVTFDVGAGAYKFELADAEQE